MSVAKDMNRPASFIGHDHPSYGTAQAWFTFAMRVRGAVTKVFLVNAKNPWAVQCIERLLGEDQKVSTTCECLMVFRDCSIGIRGDLAEEISFEEFVSVIVDKDRFLNDPLTIEAFQQAISATSMPLLAAPPPRRPQPAPVKTVAEKAAPAPKKAIGGPGYAKVSGVLTGLGYKQAQLEPILKGLDVDFESGNVNEIVHTALQALAA